ncbi:059R [Invertebrate iridescent virus 6]|uniref:059R n=1 Tax=Invertebrate iridescent virus 6 TaxID=176652 RepID=Q91G42_IIV6|nr:059R [Invertebrate iridescent virus 6]AAK81990.1 059R [Invertebrate iridescent virus 6]
MKALNRFLKVLNLLKTSRFRRVKQYPETLNQKTTINYQNLK